MPHSQGLSNNPYPEPNQLKILKALLPSSILATCHAHLNILDLITLTILGERYKLRSSSLWSLLHSPFSSQGPKYSPQDLLLLLLIIIIIIIFIFTFPLAPRVYCIWLLNMRSWVRFPTLFAWRLHLCELRSGARTIQYRGNNWVAI